MMLTKTPIYTIEQIRRLEQLAVQSGISEQLLMTRAGEAAFEYLRDTWPKAKHLVVICGKGNNAGDGYMLASLAHHHDYQVTILYLAHPDDLTGTAQWAARQAQATSVSMQAWDEAMRLTTDVIIDALLGIGIQGEVSWDYQQVISWINAQQKPVLAMDVPSGVEVDTGRVNTVAVKAQQTITFIGAKLGLYTGAAVDYCGEICIADLNLPVNLLQSIPTEIMQIQNFQWPKRHASAHKGNFGHVLIMGGDYGMGGSVCLTAEAALRSGAGLVSVATRPEHAYSLINHRPEIMAHGIQHSDELQPLIDKATILVIGPGLGQDDWGRRLWQAVKHSTLPMIVDADALNLLAQAPEKNLQWILTPHPGEAARLLKTDTKNIQHDRLQAVRTLQQQYQGICLLKGAGSLIAGDSGVTVCKAGNPGMASAGMGDVLSGIIAGVLAQIHKPYETTIIAVYQHAHAADKARQQRSEQALIASDVIACL